MRSGDSDADDAARGRLGQARHFRKGLALCSGGSSDFVNQHRARNAAPARDAFAAGQGHVVGHDHHLDGDALQHRLAHGQTEAQSIARVVLDDEQRAGGGASRGGGSRHCPNACEHGFHAWAGEHLSGDRGRKHARADKSRMRRRVSVAPAAHERHLLGRFSLPLLAQHHFDLAASVQSRAVRVEQQKSFD